MKRDLIDELNSGIITVDEAYIIFDRWLADGGTEPEQLGFSRAEYTAYCHGAPFDALGEWRARGWPKTCSICGKSLGAVNDFSWFVWDQDAKKTGNYRGKIGLAHVSCLPDRERQHDS